MPPPLQPPPFNSRLIIDVGAHRGDDSAFYLAKGFGVVAIEANPALAALLHDRFASEIASGAYRVVEGAVADAAGDVEFFVNLDKDDWSSTNARYGQRDGTSFKTIRVPAVRFDDLLADAPPYYVKTDIEGGDIEVLKALLRAAALPKYFSVEAHDGMYLGYLAAAGYRRFKLVNQNLNWAVKLPNPPLEGVYVEHTFVGDSSGPFGEEAPGEWMDFNETAEMYLALLRAVKRQPTISNAWYDFHATM